MSDKSETLKFWKNFQKRLETDGGLIGVKLHSEKAKSRFGCNGETLNGTKFHLTVGTGFSFMTLNMPKDGPIEQGLTNALSKVCGYDAYCRYVDGTKDNVMIIEWDRENPEENFKSLRKANKKSLERIKPDAAIQEEFVEAA